MDITGMAYTSPYSVNFILSKEYFCTFVISKKDPWNEYRKAILKKEENKINVFLIEELNSAEKIINKKVEEDKYIIFDLPEKLKKINADIVDVQSHEKDVFIKKVIDPNLLEDKIRSMPNGIDIIPKVDLHSRIKNLAPTLSKKAKYKNNGFKKTFEEVLKSVSKDVDLWIKKNKKKYSKSLVLKLKKYCHKIVVRSVVDYIPFSAMRRIKYKGKTIFISKQTINEIRQFSTSFAGDLAVQAYHDMTIYKTKLNKACSSIYADPNTVQYFINLFKIDHDNIFEYNKDEDDPKKNRIKDNIIIKRENIVFIETGKYSLKKILIKTGICESKEDAKHIIKNKKVKVKAKKKTKKGKKFYMIEKPTRLLIDGKVYKIKTKVPEITNAC